MSEYLLFISKLYKVKNPKFEKIISITGLNEYKNHKIEKLSKGCKQRVGIARSLATLYILDEPTTGLHQI